MPRILLSFSHRKQLIFKLSSKTKDFKFFLMLYEGENTFDGKRQSGSFTVFSSLQHSQ